MIFSSRERRFRALLGRHQDRVYRFARYLTGSADEAADVAQDVLVRLWEHADDLDPAQVEPWLLRVTKNACIDAIRKRNTYRRYVPGGDDAVALAPAGGPTPLAALEATEFTAQVEEGLQTLPDVQRACVVLREVQGYSYDDISTALDLPLNTVKVYLHRGRKALRHFLQDVYETEPEP